MVGRDVAGNARQGVGSVEHVEAAARLRLAGESRWRSATPRESCSGRQGRVRSDRRGAGFTAGKARLNGSGVLGQGTVRPARCWRGSADMAS